MPVHRHPLPRWVKTRLHKASKLYRRASWRRRSLPDFILVGAQKSGTTSLQAHLSEHPQLLPSYIKGIHFFDGGLNAAKDNFERGEAWYRSHFPLRSELGTDKKTFEASPLYIFNPLAPGRIHSLVPDAKLIVILRNPTERAISHYFHERRKGRESAPLLEALQDEERRLEPVIANGDYKSPAFRHYSYKQRGLYRDQIERYLRYFPKSRMLVLCSERYFADPAGSLREVFEFLEIDPGFRPTDLKPRNIGSNRSAVDAEIYEYLNSYFRPHNQALYHLVGDSFGW